MPAIPIRRKLLRGYKLRIQHIHIIQLHVTIRSSVTITFFDPASSLKTREIQLELVLWLFKMHVKLAYSIFHAYSPKQEWKGEGVLLSQQ
jgi:hypothetical protein